MEYITNLTGVGVAGIAVFLCFRLADGQMAKNTEALNKLADAIAEIKNLIYTIHASKLE